MYVISGGIVRFGDKFAVFTLPLGGICGAKAYRALTPYAYIKFGNFFWSEIPGNVFTSTYDTFLYLSKIGECRYHSCSCDKRTCIHLELQYIGPE